MLFNSKLQILYFTFLLAALTLPMSTVAQTARARVHVITSVESVAPGSEIEVKVTVGTEEPINAFDISLEYLPAVFELVRASTDNSIAQIWQSLPIKSENGKILFLGGMTKPFSGDGGEIITVVFKAKNSGVGNFLVTKADLALADGKGTLINGGRAKSSIVVSEEAVLTASEIKSSAPKIREVVFAEDSVTGSPLISVWTENDGSVKEIQMRARSWFLWGDWFRAERVASIPKYAWAIEIRALGFGDEETRESLYRWDIATFKLFGILATLFLLGFIIYRWRRMAEKVT